ncbi:MAG TPA: beta-propeller fold lactonase family protein [Candidatus Acidoferrum sp.]|nr:beta-propeller fold lactonase family protein [Candidatus Acidoferrum sp.]
MVKRAAALFLVCVSLATWVGCGPTSSNYMYVAIPGSNEIVVYREDPNSGILTQLVGSPILAGLAVHALVIHPSGKFLYAANTSENDVSLFTISRGGGLTEITPRTVVGNAPTLIAMDAAGTFLYVGNSGSNNISVFSIGASNGALTPVVQTSGQTAPIGLSPINMQVSPSGGVLYVTGASSSGGTSLGLIEAFSLTQGVLSVLLTSPYSTGINPYGLAITPKGGFLYTANNINDSISEFTIEADGSLAPFANSPFGQPYPGPLALQIDKSGTYLYVANQASTFVSAYSIGSDGALVGLTTSPFSTGADPSVLANDKAGKYLFVGNQKSPAIQSFSLDTGSGTLTSVATYTLPGTPTSIAVTP